MHTDYMTIHMALNAHNLYGQTLSSFGPAAAQYKTSGFRRHPNQKAMGSFSFGICFIGQSLFHIQTPISNKAMRKS
jgi:hypothetical protein